MGEADTPRYRRYAVGTGTEWMLTFGAGDRPRILILTPILNEMNLTRAVVVDMARRLSALGYACAIPDLPGCGESLVPLGEIGWGDWRAAAASAAEAWRGKDGEPPHLVSLRGGCLLDDDGAAASRWRFSPADGQALLRPLERAQRISRREGEAPGVTSETVMLAGFRFASSFVAALRTARPAPVEGSLRTVEVERSGIPVWRRAEPTSDPDLAARLSIDIADWIASCVN